MLPRSPGMSGGIVVGQTGQRAQEERCI